MNPRRAERINIALLLLSLLIACVAPFHLFLFAYAVLGPAHYLTEIPWLHQRGYFLPHQKDYWSLLLITASICALVLLRSPHIEWATDLLAGAFLISATFVFFRGTMHRLLALGAGALAISVFRTHAIYVMFFSVMLTRIVHVFLFTGLFLIGGALRSRQTLSWLSCILFFGSAAASFMLPTLGDIPNATQYVRSSYQQFVSMNLELMRWLGLESKGEIDGVFNSESGWRVMRFVAFAFTYHYLNWFSKTALIGWNKFNRAGWCALILTWTLSLAIYAYDYQLGLAVLMFLSLLHVTLEFPLNFQTLRYVTLELRARLMSAPDA